jgi:hypothetical protein
MRTSLTAILLFLCFILKSQNLYLSSGCKISRLSLNAIHTSPTANYSSKNFKSTIFFLDINMLFETKINNLVSIKTGIYLPHPQKADYITYHYDGGYFISFKDDISYFNVESPLLLSFNIPEEQENLKFNFDFGPYIGYGFFKSPEEKIISWDSGLDLSLGIRVKKWGFTFYYLTSFKNRVVGDAYVKKATGKVVGLNLTRIISLKHKEININEKL